MRDNQVLESFSSPRERPSKISWPELSSHEKPEPDFFMARGKLRGGGDEFRCTRMQVAEVGGLGMSPMLLCVPVTSFAYCSLGPGWAWGSERGEFPTG